MPVVFFFFIGTVTSGFGRGGGGPETLAVRAGDDAGFLIDQVVRRLEDRGYWVVRPRSEEELAQRSRRLTFPPGFTDSVLAGRPVTVRFEHDENGLGSDYQRVRVGRAIYTVLADLIVTGEMGESPTPEALAALNAMPRALTLEVSAAGKRRRIPTGFEQAIPGIMVMFTLLVMTTSAAVLLVIERQQGLLRRLASTPINRLGVVLGKWSGKLVVGIVQIAFAMLAGSLLFRMTWGAHLPMILLVMLVYGGLMAALGVVLGSLARNEGQAVAIGVISSNVLAALGGCWWPIEITPEWMQKLQLFLPTGWAMDALHKLISFGAGPASVLPHTIGMSAATLVLVVLATRVFRFE
jgi:ABC-type Na+ efflux pump permease subunit